jgi:UDP-N-acetylmuramate--alanine ligase
MQTVKHRIKAAHRYEVVGSSAELSIAGKIFHLIGAGGIGMSGLAQVLLNKNAIVSGSDKTASTITEKLRRSGADIRIGHHADNLKPQTDAVVISAAITEDNPELKLARHRGLKVYKYAQMLGELMGRHRGIAISGTHGKSTTTGWLAYCLRQAGIDTNFVVGAEVTQLGSSSGTGSSEYFVAEACEYDRSFLNLKPTIACILNIERDHLDCYKDEQEIVEAFTQFALGVGTYGLVVANGHDPNVAKIIGQLRNRVDFETFGLDNTGNYQGRNIKIVDGLYTFDVFHNDTLLGSTKISMPGRHNVLNALAVAAMAVNAGVPGELILQLLPQFTGVDRRSTLKGRFNEVTILDDYAHHPTEIKATLEAIRQRYLPRRLWCVFQPHQYSRTKYLLEEFAGSFGQADIVIIPEIYFVRDLQADKESVNSQILVEKVRANGTKAVSICDFGAVCDYLEANVTAGDLVVTMGAGDVWKVADEYIQRLRANS